MPNKLKRYTHPDVVEHLASRYALGAMTAKARARLEQLIQSDNYSALAQSVSLQQNQLGQLDALIEESTPDEQVWQSLQQSMGLQESPPTNTKVVKLEAKQTDKWFKKVLPLAASIMLFALVLMYTLPAQQSQLSYIAVMTNSSNQAALVAATYGDTKALTLDFVDLAPLGDDESYELWVTSKSDQQVRSLGVIDPATSAFTRTLSEAEWRLIKDSATLIVTIEEFGGSSIGEPMGEHIAEGLCVRLSAWEA